MCFLSRRPTITIVIWGLCVLGVFILDLITPLGVPVWLLYGVPFLFLHEYTLGITFMPLKESVLSSFLSVISCLPEPNQNR
jgi:hypothetical protein